MRSPFASPRLRSLAFEIMRTLLAILLALVLACGIIALTSETPMETIRIFLTAPFANDYTRGKMITEAVPLIFTGVAVCIMVQAGQFNMIGEGTFFLGAFVGAILTVRLQLPPIFIPIVAILAAALIAAAVGYVPAQLKARLKVNEFVSSLMLNFILFWIVMYLFNNVFADPNYSSLATHYMQDHQRLPFLNAETEVSSSFLIAIGFTLLTWAFLYRTHWGYTLRMTGYNSKFARYCGIATGRVIVLAQVLGAALAGLGGAAFMLGNFYRFTWKALPNYGFDGFIVAIMARNQPLLVPFVALFLGYLRVGAMEMARLSDVPNEVIYIIQAVMILIVGGQAFLARWRHRRMQQRLSEKGDATHV